MIGKRNHYDYYLPHGSNFRCTNSFCGDTEDYREYASCHCWMYVFALMGDVWYLLYRVHSSPVLFYLNFTHRFSSCKGVCSNLKQIFCIKWHCQRLPTRVCIDFEPRFEVRTSLWSLWLKMVEYVLWPRYMFQDQRSISLQDSTKFGPGVWSLYYLPLALFEFTVYR